jgi:NAD(P)-dependent dehydrogenase (short-subunit alcohol dehydrogenase family)
VAATARDPKALKALVEGHGDAILRLQLDVTDRDAVFQAVRQSHQHFGRLAVILSNAGYGLHGAAEEVELDDVRANFETNVFGTLSVIRAALPLLRAPRWETGKNQGLRGGEADFGLLCSPETLSRWHPSMDTEAEAIQSSPRFFPVSFRKGRPAFPPAHDRRQAPGPYRHSPSA